MKKVSTFFIILFWAFVSTSSLIAQPIPVAPQVGEPLPYWLEGYTNSTWVVQSLANLFWITAPDSVVPSPSRSERTNRFYYQICDINATPTQTWYPDGEGGYKGFLPIGDVNSSVIYYDGGGFGICNLYINRPEMDYVGLFARAGVEIRYLAVSNANITGKDYVGALAGTTGIGCVCNSYSSGSVSGQNYVGGLVGEGLGPRIFDSYSTASVNGNTNVGGLIGWIDDDSKVQDSYAAGSVNGTGSDVGGLIGHASGTPNLINCFWDTQSTGQSTSSGGSGKTTYQMKLRSTFTDDDWLFSPDGAVWSIKESNNLISYPYLQPFNYHFTLPDPLPILYYPEIELKYASGDGSSGDPYQITDWRQLDHVRSDLGAFFVLNNDLDDSCNGYNLLASATANGGAGWLPIGDVNSQFSGNFNGNGHTIDGLHIGRPLQDLIGLFGFVSFGSISNLGLTNIAIAGRDYVGGLVGNSESGTYTNVYSTGNISEARNLVGGLIGSNIGDIDNSYSTANVSGVSYVGGLVSFNIGTITNTYSTGSVTGSESVGGLVGLNSGTVTSSFWDTETSKQETSSGGTGKSTDEMKVESTFTNADWDFRIVWTISSENNDGYPYSMGRIIQPVGEGTEENPYQIANLENLSWLTIAYDSWDKNFIQTANIDASSTSTWDNGGGFWHIGNSEIPFTGNYDGGGDTIFSLTGSQPSWGYSGMFGIVEGSEIKNLTLSSLSIEGSSNTGGLVGMATNATISNIAVSGVVTAYLDCHGGLLGKASGCTITDCSSSVNVTGGDDVGGFIGQCINGQITNCYSVADVVGEADYVGGFIGYNIETVLGSATISDCYCTATSVISEGWSIGGFIGQNQYGQVVNCYSTANVIANATHFGAGAGGNVGGFIGYNLGDVNIGEISYTEVSKCYSTGNVTAMVKASSTDKDVGGFIGEAGGLIENCYSRSSVSTTGDGTPEVGVFIANAEAQAIVQYCYTTGDYTTVVGNHGFIYTNSGTVFHNFYDSELSSQDSGTGALGKTTAEMKTESTFTDAGWDFDIWAIKSGINDGYPFPIGTTIKPTGDGTEANPYQIANLGNLYWLSTAYDSYDKQYIQTANIDASPTSTWNDGSGFFPIGYSDDGPFTGNYDGDGYTISSLTCYYPDRNCVGLFGFVDGSEIKDLTLVDLSIEGRSSTAGLAGVALNATISNIAVSGTITMLVCDFTGGLIGKASGCTITGCSSSANVTGVQDTGGLIGLSLENDISASNCTATSVSGSLSCTGGFIGRSINDKVDNCYSTADVVGETYSVGGFIGTNSESTLGLSTISDCYCTATSVIGGGCYIGGFIGLNQYGQIVDCYSTANVISTSIDSDSGNRVGGFIGSNSGDANSGDISYTEVLKCYATGNVTAKVNASSISNGVGGFIGDAGGVIENCYSRGNVSTTGDGIPEVGVFIANVWGSDTDVQFCYTTGDYTTAVGNYGFIYTNSGTVSHNFYDSDLSSQNSGLGATGKTTVEMKKQPTFIGWDFTDTWAISANYNDGYPNLNHQNEYLWEGSISEDWNTAGNWNIGTVPTLIGHVIIPSGATHNPVLSASVSASCNNLTVENGATLSIESNVNGTGSLIINGTISNNGTISSQRYFPGAALQNWHMVSSPMINTDISENNFAPGNNDDFYAWEETSPGIWVNYKTDDPDQNSTFATINGSDDFVAGKGYLVAYNEANPTKIFTGTLNAGSQTFDLKNSSSKSWTYNSGWNLMGNPYSSAIDWHEADRTLFLDDFAYAYNPAAGGGAGGFEEIDGASNGAFISANQAFFVHATMDANNLPFTFTTAMQTHGGEYFKNTIENDELVLRLTGELYYDETTIRQRDESTFNKDRIDAFKMNSYNVDSPNIYSVSDDDINLSVNSIPLLDTLHTIRIGMVAPKTGSYNISVVKASNHMMDNNIYLEDRLLDLWYKISESEYSFTTDAGDISDRFVIHFGVTGIEDITSSSDVIYAWAYNSTITIYNPRNIAGELRVYNMYGQTVGQTLLNRNISQKINLYVPDGYYIVNIITNKQAVNRKVYLR